MRGENQTIAVVTIEPDHVRGCTTPSATRWDWRLLNASRQSHPMHLDGFYFTTDGRGDTDSDTIYAADGLPKVVTDVMPDFSSLRMTWVPERSDNWLFTVTSELSCIRTHRQRVTDASLSSLRGCATGPFALACFRRTDGFIRPDRPVVLD